MGTWYKAIVNNPFERFFGKSQNGTIAELLVRQAEIAASCAQTLAESAGKSLPEIVAFEREGDLTEGRVHEILDNAFILRFDKSDIANLSETLDNILDGMRHAATHVDTYAPYLPKLQGEAQEFMRTIVEMTNTVAELTQLLESRRISLSKVKEFKGRLAKAEAHADSILHRAESALVREHEKNGNGSTLAFIAHDTLFRILERITDTANHCGTLMLSIARKEA